MVAPSPLSKHQTEKPLRQVAAEKLHGKGSNPSQIGDPVSLKAETANSHPTDQDAGSHSRDSESLPPPNAAAGSSHSPATQGQSGSTTPSNEATSGASGLKTRSPPSSSGGSHEEKQLKEGRSLRGMMKEKIAQADKGENRTMIGDPVSLKAEKVEDEPVDHDNGPSGKKGSSQRKSKL